MYQVELSLPPTCCGANYKTVKVKGRIHDGQFKAAYRQECKEKIKQAIKKWDVPLPFTVPVVMHFDWYTGRGDARQKLQEVINPCARPRDVGNAIAAAKVATDAFMDAGVLVDDDYKHVPSITATIYGEKSEHAGRAALVVSISFMET